MLALAPSSANASPNCLSNPSQGLICLGDKAWKDGFLVTPAFVSACRDDHFLSLSCASDHALAAKVPDLQEERNQAIAQRDSYKEHSAAIDALLVSKTGTVNALLVENSKLKVQLDRSFGYGSLAIAGLAGAGVTTIIVGILVLRK